MSNPLIPNRFLFRFSLPCLYRDRLWTAGGTELEEQFRLVNLAELEGRPRIADVRAAWNESGLAFSVRVTGKSQAPWCRASKPEDSDCFQVWIDTRDVHNVHRAGRYCHRLIFLPAGAGDRSDEPMAQCLAINRAKEPARPIQPKQLNVRGKIQADGYLLEVSIPGDALTGFDPQEHPRLGFTYAVIDRELGEQTLTVGSPMPYQEDPSLWATLELIKNK
jgi:hypothetical protein